MQDDTKYSYAKKYAHYLPNSDETNIEFKGDKFPQSSYAKMGPYQQSGSLARPPPKQVLNFNKNEIDILSHNQLQLPEISKNSSQGLQDIQG